MGLSPYDKKRYKESKLRRRQALYQSETGYIVPYRRSKKPIIIAACAAALLLIAAAVVLVVASLDNRDAGSSSRQTDLNSEERLRVVNRANTVDKDFKPALKSFGGVKVHKDIVNSLEKLTAAAESRGIDLKLTKGYVSYEDQKKLFDENLEVFLKKPEYTPVRAQAAAQKLVPEAGSCEAQTGLLVEFDLTDPKAKAFMERECINYGFILRFPEGKEDITHIQPLESAYRYVGRADAEKMRTFDMCLEEYVDYISNQSVIST